MKKVIFMILSLLISNFAQAGLCRSMMTVANIMFSKGIYSKSTSVTDLKDGLYTVTFDENGIVFSDILNKKTSSNEIPSLTGEKAEEAALYAYYRLDFLESRDGNDSSKWRAQRSPLDHYYGGRATVENMKDLKTSLKNAIRRDQFDIFVIRVSKLPPYLNSSGLIIVKGTAQLRSLQVETDGFIFNNGQVQLPYDSLLGGVVYAWRGHFVR